MSSWKNLKISLIETESDLNSSRKKPPAIHTEKGSHGHKCKRGKCTTTTTVGKKQVVGEVSIRPPWIEDVFQMNELARGDSSCSNTHYENYNSKKVPKTDTNCEAKLLMTKICERLHKGIGAKVERIPKPKVPKTLDVSVIPVIAPEVMAQIEESYYKRLQASVKPKPNRPPRAYHETFKDWNHNRNAARVDLQPPPSQSNHTRHVYHGRRTKFMMNARKFDRPSNRCCCNYEMPRRTPSLLCSGWNPIAYQTSYAL